VISMMRYVASLTDCLRLGCGAATKRTPPERLLPRGIPLGSRIRGADEGERT
jgi:hypothetical protein